MPIIPGYTPPDFSLPELAAAPLVRTEPAVADGVLPDGFHATSNHPEYVHVSPGRWLLTHESRMDGVMVLRGDNLEVVEPRRIAKGDPVVIARSHNGTEGVYVHTVGFKPQEDYNSEEFAFRTRGTRETPFSRSYETLYELLRHDREHGYIVWVLGPAVAFDRDSRKAMAAMISAGYCHALLAGNALATHDLEAARFRTGLDQDIYTQELHPGGHCNHLDTINLVRRSGSISAAIAELDLGDGIMGACVRSEIPYVLAGSIRDDGPLPDVITDSRAAQDAMRVHARRATTVLALATELASSLFGKRIL